MKIDSHGRNPRSSGSRLLDIEFSDHAIGQLKKRGLSVNNVNETVKNPEKKIRSFKNRMLRQRRFGSKILEVVTVTEGSIITIITAYYLESREL